MGICAALCSDQEFRSLELPLHLYLLLSPQLLEEKEASETCEKTHPGVTGVMTDEPERQVHPVLYLSGWGSSPQREELASSWAGSSGECDSP